jgi:hypothetical protein
MTQVGQLIMLKTVPFYSIIRSLELRNTYDMIMRNTLLNIPKDRQELNLENAKYIISQSASFGVSSKWKRSNDLTNLIRCCKEYISIAKQ